MSGPSLRELMAELTRRMTGDEPLLVLTDEHDTQTLIVSARKGPPRLFLTAVDRDDDASSIVLERDAVHSLYHALGGWLDETSRP